MNLTKKVVLAAIFALTMFVPSFQPVMKADPTTTVVTLTTNAIDIYLMIDGMGDGYKPRLPPPPPPPPKS